ncbi:adenylate kinase isoenzyme 1-like [Prorops nasuta]|uniref:adenylate kinase isoenzyme 1-like n=1 Tax=Prorops nasuta TaxID=863751 RepID=UPI0034CE2E60
MGNCLRKILKPFQQSIPKQMAADSCEIRSSNLPIIFLIGGPGAGKQTQSSKAAERYNLVNLNTLEIVREEIVSRSEIGITLAHTLMEGKLVPADVLLELLKMRMIKSLKHTNGFLLSGFPKHIDQGKLFDKRIKPADLVIFLDVRTSVMEDRIAAKMVTENERYEDSSHEVQKSINEFEKFNGQITRHYNKQLVVIDGEEEIPIVFESICLSLDSVLRKNQSSKEEKLKDDNYIVT